MSGMTGNVPYYGGRMSPAQAYAASHPAPPRPQAPPPQTQPRGPALSQRDRVEALDLLLDTGVIDQAEYDQLRARMAQ
jgi:hypothetical protein